VGPAVPGRGHVALRRAHRVCRRGDRADGARAGDPRGRQQADLRRQRRAGAWRSLPLNDASMLTCPGNDLGYDRVFAKQIELHARGGDLVIAISSSGRSANILNAVDAATAAGCTVATLSGFSPDNPLRRKGRWNFYVASDRYGFVEIGALTICHAVLDFLCGLPAPP